MTRDMKFFSCIPLVLNPNKLVHLFVLDPFVVFTADRVSRTPKLYQYNMV